jgi:uncharacterized protein with ParB-like and HNH nuclease domain
MNNVNQNQHSTITEEELIRKVQADYDSMEEQLRKEAKRSQFSTLDSDVSQICSKAGDNFLRIDEIKYDELNEEMYNDLLSQERELHIPEYQRRYTWTIDMRAKFIESLLLNIPIPSLFLCRLGDNTLDIVDGYQRISTIVAFKENNLRLQNLTILTSLNNKTYSDLPSFIRRQFDQARLHVIIFDNQNNVKEVFKRLNTTGSKLNPAELRHAMYEHGEFYKMIQTLKQNKTFREICPLSADKEKRMEYEELLVRFYQG